MCGLITRQLRTAIELYREAIRFTAKSKVQNSFYAAIQRECLDEWLCEKRGGEGSTGSHSMPSATVALKKPFKSFSLFLSLAKTMSIKFSTRVKQKRTPKNQRELPTEKFTTISQERCLQFTTTKYLRRWRERRQTKNQTNPKKCVVRSTLESRCSRLREWPFVCYFYISRDKNQQWLKTLLCRHFLDL
jgi:hypothetical protein